MAVRQYGRVEYIELKLILFTASYCSVGLGRGELSTSLEHVRYYETHSSWLCCSEPCWSA